MGKVGVVLAMILAATSALMARPADTSAQNGEVQFCNGLQVTKVANGAGDVRGGASNDVIWADEGIPQVIYGSAGHDTICAGAGDVVYAGSGNDTVIAVGAAVVYGESGNDFVQSFSAGAVYGGSGNDVLIDSFDGQLYGESGNDTLISAAFCNGGSGYDTAENCDWVEHVEQIVNV